MAPCSDSPRRKRQLQQQLRQRRRQVHSPPTKQQQLANDIALRKAYAKVIDQQLLNQGIESEPYTVGPEAKTLAIKDVLAGRVRQNAIQQNDSWFRQARALGCKRIAYSNGLEGDLYFSIYWDL